MGSDKRCDRCFKLLEGGHERDGSDHCWCTEDDAAVREEAVVALFTAIEDSAGTGFAEAWVNARAAFGLPVSNPKMVSTLHAELRRARTERDEQQKANVTLIEARTNAEKNAEYWLGRFNDRHTDAMGAEAAMSVYEDDLRKRAIEVATLRGHISALEAELQNRSGNQDG